MRVRFVLCLVLCLSLFSCGPRKKTAPAAANRPFPMAEIPIMFEEPDERLSWLVQHFWDRFTDPDKLYLSDSLHINGVLADDVEKQMGIFATVLLENASPKDGESAMERLFDQSEAFQKTHPSGNLFPRMNDLVIKYFYDPNSPLRSEALYLPYATRLASSELITPLERQRYARDAKLCALNRPGTPAADFRFIDSFGHARTLYGIKARLTLLIFGNPDCHACRDLQAAMEENAELSSTIASGELKVVDIYIDEDIETWKQRIPEYPASWTNGYDPDFVIRADLIYNVRALPSLYLLDQDKTVILKDCTPEQLFATLGF